MDTGVSVIALTENAHHQKHLDIALLERAVEAMLAGSRIFKDEALQARALEFCPTTTVKKEKEKEKESASPFPPIPQPVRYQFSRVLMGWGRERRGSHFAVQA